MREEDLSGYLWRKMESGIPAYPISKARPDLDETFFIDTKSEIGVFPDLVRWKGMEEAFLGFVSRGCRRPHAVVYDLDRVEAYVSHTMGRSGFGPDDDFHLRIYIRSNILGVWFGEKTPYLLSAVKNPDTIAQIDRYFGQ